MQQHDRHIHVWRHRREHTWHACIRYHHTSLERDLMVWKTIWGQDKNPVVRVVAILNSQRYIYQILKQMVVPCFRRLVNVIFQEDNARPHVSRRVLNYLETEGFWLLSWPAPSGHLSPTETLRNGLLREWVTIALQPL